MTGADAPVTYQQETMLDAVERCPRPQVYNVGTRLGLRGPLDETALSTALTALVGRHAALRSRFTGGAGNRSQQEITPPSRILDADDLSRLPAEAGRRIAGEICQAMAEQPFDLARSTVPVARLLRLSADESILMLVTHHITTDGWALSLILRELGELYRAARTGTAQRLTAPGAQAADYARWQRGRPDPVPGALAYWREALAGVRLDKPLPADRERPDRPTGAGGTVRTSAPAAVRTAVERRARECGVTAFAVSAACLARHVSRLSGADHVLLTVSYANRESRAFESMVTCTRVGAGVLVPVAGAAGAGDLALRAAEATIGSIAHLVPVSRVLSELAPGTQAVGLAYQNFPEAGLVDGDLCATVEDVAPDAARQDLTFGLVPRPDGYAAWLEYSRDRWTEQSAQLLLRGFLDTLAGVCDG